MPRVALITSRASFLLSRFPVLELVIPPWKLTRFYWIPSNCSTAHFRRRRAAESTLIKKLPKNAADVMKLYHERDAFNKEGIISQAKSTRLIIAFYRGRIRRALEFLFTLRQKCNLVFAPGNSCRMKSGRPGTKASRFLKLRRNEMYWLFLLSKPGEVMYAERFLRPPNMHR